MNWLKETWWIVKQLFTKVKKKEYDIEESESEEDIDKAIDELRHEINELKEIQQI